SAAAYLEAVENLQRFARGVARVLTTIDVWLTPTMSTPPPLLGASYEEGQASVRYPAVVANITGNPAMSVPLCWNEAGPPIRAHFPGRFGDEATLIRLAAKLERARTCAGRVPPITAFREGALA